MPTRDDDSDLEDFPIPSPTFDGNKKDTEPFLLQVEDYFFLTRGRYNTDQKKVLFVLGRTKAGTAAEEWAKSKRKLYLAPDSAFPTWEAFQEEMKAAFPYSKADAIAELGALKQTGTARGYIIEFQNLAHWSRSGLTHNETLMLYFQCGLKPGLLNRISKADIVPDTIEGWYESAKKLDENYQRRKAIEAHCRQIRAYNPRSNTMELSVEQRAEYMKKGLCFRCGVKGHRFRECPVTSGSEGFNDVVQSQNNKHQPMSAKEGAAEIIALMNSLDDVGKEGIRKEIRRLRRS